LKVALNTIKQTNKQTNTYTNRGGQVSVGSPITNLVVEGDLKHVLNQTINSNQPGRKLQIICGR